MRRDLISLAVVALFLTLGMTVGGVWGDQLGRVGGARAWVENDDRDKLESLLSVLQQRAAQPFDSAEALYDGAIPGMLQRLDPHSQFFDPGDFERLREEHRGSYAGVGMQIRLFDGRPIVDYPFPDTPAARAGLRPGDVIRTVDGVSTEGMSVNEVANTVRGQPGTAVQLELTRSAGAGMIEVDLIRDDIPRPSIPLAFEIQPGVGYLRITTFGETTEQELEQALAGLEDRGLEGLVLDLRDNVGGLLRAGVGVAGRFLDDNAPVVSHRGRRDRERIYRAASGRGRSRYPMAVLVNCRSASASEIVAGALQDHDRALIVGGNTFGKGLVQNVFTLAGSVGLTLTTARYYTPSGRQIQRPWEGVSRSSYYADPCDADFEPARTEARLTANGRSVYGGGGIEPDIYSAAPNAGYWEQRALEQRVFERFADTLDLRKIAPDWRPSAETLTAFLEFARERLPEVDWTAPGRDLFVRRNLRLRVLTAAHDIDVAQRAEAELDPQVLRALSLLPEAAQLLNPGSRGVVARGDD